MRKILLISFLTAMLFSCNKKDEDKTKSELEPLAYTLYTDKLELFVEFKPLVVGEVSRFAAHITVLGESFKSLDVGKVTVSVTENGSAVVDAPNPPGIFRPEIKPVKAGNNFKVTFDVVTKDFTDQFVIDDITVYPDMQTAIGSQVEEPEGNEIPYLKEQAWKVDFANQEVQKQMFFYTVRTTGQIITPPSDEAIISAKSSGIVTFNGNSYISGMPVRQGEGLFSVSGSNLNEQNINTKILEAKYNYEKAEADYDRATELIKDKIISEKEFLAIENTFEVARTIYTSLTQNYTGAGVRVYSPISGFIRTVNVQQGQFVEAGQTLAVISKNNRLLLKADLSQKYFDIINQIQSANFKTPDGKTYDTESLNGSYIVSGKSTGQDNLLLPINFEIDYRNDLIPGTFVEVFLKTTRIPDALVIPVSSLIEEQGVFYVYVQTSGEGFEKREVSVTGSDGILVQVLSGIDEGERVVTKGAYQIKLSSMSGTMPVHGHEH
jgi:membrane fusion protein, heavy metal efflux system